jgi:hypothetical protein
MDEKMAAWLKATYFRGERGNDLMERLKKK